MLVLRGKSTPSSFSRPDDVPCRAGLPARRPNCAAAKVSAAEPPPTVLIGLLLEAGLKGGGWGGEREAEAELALLE